MIKYKLWQIGISTTSIFLLYFFGLLDGRFMLLNILLALIIPLFTILFINPKEHLLWEITYLSSLLSDENLIHYNSKSGNGYEIEISNYKSKQVTIDKNDERIYSSGKGVNEFLTTESILKLIPEIKALQKETECNKAYEKQRKLEINNKLWKEEK